MFIHVHPVSYIFDFQAEKGSWDRHRTVFRCIYSVLDLNEVIVPEAWLDPKVIVSVSHSTCRYSRRFPKYLSGFRCETLVLDLKHFS